MVDAGNGLRAKEKDAMIKPYRGAGILFLVMEGGNPEILLGKRCQSGIWSIPGGGQHKNETDFWSTANRETKEEFRGLCLAPDQIQTPCTQGKTYFYPCGNSQMNADGRIQYEQLFDFSYPFLLFDWKTFIVKLSAKPPVEEFPNKLDHGFLEQFSDAKWFPLNQLPPKMHWLLWPIIWRLKLSQLMNRCSVP